MSETKIILVATGMVLVGVLCVVAVADLGDAWVVLLSVAALAVFALAIVIDMRRVIDRGADDPDAPEPVPGRAVVVCTGAMTAEQVLEALAGTHADQHAIMFVAPAGLGTRGLPEDHGDHDRAMRAQTETVAALRHAGIKATGHVGDRHPGHAIDDALAIFGAATVVIVTRESEAEVYRRDVDLDALARRSGVEVRILEAVAAEGSGR
jgi:hypothetical protein